MCTLHSTFSTIVKKLEHDNKNMWQLGNFRQMSEIADTPVISDKCEVLERNFCTSPYIVADFRNSFLIQATKITILVVGVMKILLCW